MDPHSGKLYASVEEAKAAGVEHPVHIEGRLEDIENISKALNREQRRQEKRALRKKGR